MNIKAVNACAGLALMLATALAVTSCGEGDTQASGEVGSVAVLLTDGPVADYDQVNVTITGIELVAGDGTTAEVFSGERTVNLLDLSDDSDVFSVADVPAGVYRRIRLTLSALELVKLDDSGAVEETVTPTLPEDGIVELNPRMDFVVSGDEPLVLQLDVDANKSIHLASLGNGGLRFRPVIFVDIVSGGVLARTTRIEGTAESLDAESQTFQLCDSRAAFRRWHGSGRGFGPWRHGDLHRFGDGIAADERCLTVQADAATAIYAGTGALAFDQIGADSHVTVFGRLLKNADDSGFTLQPRLVAVGPDSDFAWTRGTVSAAYDTTNGQFAIDVTRGGSFRSFTTGESISVAGLPETAVYARSGEELGLTDIAAGFGVKVFGIPTGTTPELQALMVFLDNTSSAVSELSGVTSAIGTDGFTLLGTDDGDVCVRVGNSTDIFLVDGGTSSAINLAEVEEGLEADVYGRLDLGSGCYRASNVIVQAVAAATN